MVPLNYYAFIDIETASVSSSFAELSPGLQKEWKRKSELKYGLEADPEQTFTERAGIFAEFGKVVCITLGCFREREGTMKLFLRSFAENDEKSLLNEFCITINRLHQQFPNLQFVGHNLKEFDMPFISRRMVILGMNVPECMNVQGRRPWQSPYIDTMQLWSFGDYKSYTRLGLLAEVLGIPSPKDDISGEDVSRVYWVEKDLSRIAHYCEKDVETTARVYLRLVAYPPFDFDVESLPQTAKAVPTQL